MQQEKATWTDISNATKIQPKELSYDLRKLLDNREITTEQDTKDRRKTWYMLRSKKKALAEIRRYETTEFILGLKNPSYDEVIHEIPYKKFKMCMKIGTFVEGKEDFEKPTILIGALNLSELLEGFSGYIENLNKFAITMTFERREKS